MKIIKYQKLKGDKYELTLENNEKIILFEDVILKEELLLKKEIENISEISRKNQEYEVVHVALNYLNHHVISIKGMQKYLEKKEYSQQIVDKTINYLIDKGYLNDEYYFKCYVNDHIKLTNDGPLKIKKHLMDNNIDVSYDIFLEYQDIFKEKVDKYIEKMLKLNKKSEYYFKHKMLINLINLGYEKEMIDEALENIKIENILDIKMKEEEKIRRKLEKKYSGIELERKIKEKLYTKGFLD